MVVPLTLDVPVRIWVVRVVLIVARYLDLLESSLGRILVRRADVAVEYGVPETQTHRERVNPIDLLTLPTVKIVDDLDLPVVALIASVCISLARNPVVQLGDRRGDIV